MEPQMGTAAATADEGALEAALEECWCLALIRCDHRTGYARTPFRKLFRTILDKGSKYLHLNRHRHLVVSISNQYLNRELKATAYTTYRTSYTPTMTPAARIYRTLYVGEMGSGRNPVYAIRAAKSCRRMIVCGTGRDM